MDKAMKIAVTLSAYDRMSTVINSAVEKSQRKLRSFQSGLNSFGNVATIGGGIATAFLGSTVKAAQESEIAAARMRQVFKSLGEQNDTAANKALDYASKLQMQIGIEDEVIAATQAKIATFKTLSSESGRMAGMFDRVTNAAFDMQAAGFGEASQNAVQLGKAMEDPIKGLAALRKSGITFTDGEKAKIKALVQSNHLLKAQQMVLSAIENQGIKGVAEATADPLVLIRISLGEIAETIGKKLLPRIKQFSRYVINDLIPPISDFAEKNSTLIKVVAAGSVALLGLGVAAKVVAFAMGGIAPVMKGVMFMMKVMQGNAAATAIAMKGLRVAMMSTGILLIVAAIAAAAYLIYKNWDGIKAWFTKLWANVTAIFSKTWKWIKNMFLNYTAAGLVIKHWSSITAWFGNLWQNVTAVFTKTWEWIKNIFFNYTPQGLIYSHWGEITQWFTNLWEKVTNIFKNAWSNIKSFFGFGNDNQADKVAASYEKALSAVNKKTAATIGFDANTNVNTTGLNSSLANPAKINTANNSSSVNYSPIINFTGNAQDATALTGMMKTNFDKQLQEHQAQQKRRAF